MTFVTPVEVRDRLRKQRANTGETIRQIILDALEARYDDLPKLMEKARPQVKRGLLFSRTVKQPTGDVKLQTNVRLSGEELAIIDELVDRFEAPDRSALLSYALDAYLD